MIGRKAAIDGLTRAYESTQSELVVLHLTLVTPCGLEHKGHWGIVQSQVTMDDLFS